MNFRIRQTGESGRIAQIIWNVASSIVLDLRSFPAAARRIMGFKSMYFLSPAAYHVCHRTMDGASKFADGLKNVAAFA